MSWGFLLTASLAVSYDTHPALGLDDRSLSKYSARLEFKRFSTQEEFSGNYLITLVSCTPPPPRKKVVDIHVYYDT